MTRCSHDNIAVVSGPVQLRRQASGRRCIRYSTRWRYSLFSEDHPTRSRQATGDSTHHAAIRHFSAEVRIYNQGPYTHPCTPIAKQTRGHDQGGIEHFVRRFARAAPLPYRGLHAARRNEVGDSLDGLPRPLTPTRLSMRDVSY